MLFAYREVPQESTGYSPIELLYGRVVQEPLDVMKELWESPKCKDESVISYVLATREAKAQNKQKQWYDRSAR